MVYCSKIPKIEHLTSKLSQRQVMATSTFDYYLKHSFPILNIQLQICKRSNYGMMYIQIIFDIEQHNRFAYHDLVQFQINSTVIYATAVFIIVVCTCLSVIIVTESKTLITISIFSFLFSISALHYFFHRFSSTAFSPFKFILLRFLLC